MGTVVKITSYRKNVAWYGNGRCPDNLSTYIQKCILQNIVLSETHITLFYILYVYLLSVYLSLIDCYYIYLLGIGTDTDIHVCMSYVFQYLQSMIMHMPQEYRHLILPDTYYFDVSILPERGLIQNYILTKKILNIILVSLLSILIRLLGYKLQNWYYIANQQKILLHKKKKNQIHVKSYVFFSQIKERNWVVIIAFFGSFYKDCDTFFSYSFFGSKMKTDYPGIEREWSNPKSVYNIGYPGINRKHGWSLKAT